MSSLRIVGLFLSLAIFFFALRKYKHKQFRKTDFTLSFVLSMSLFAVSIEPDIINVLSDALTGRYKETNRLVSILIVSTVVLIVLVFRLMLRSNVTEKNISDLVQALAIARFYEEYTDKKFERKILVIIPAYDEEENLRELLKAIPSKIHDHELETVVVVDGATDNTEQTAKELGAAVIINRINRGGGAAIRVGCQLAVAKNAEIVVTMDADGQHLPGEIEKMVEPIIYNEVDFTSGSRMLGSQEKGDPVRQAGIFIFNKLISLLLWRKITDCSNAFRALRVSEFRKVRLQEDQFHTSELIIDAVKRGVRFKEVPISVVRRQSGETKKPRSLKYGWEFLKAMISAWWRT